MSDAALRIRNRDYLGWQSIAVTRSMESLASSFDLELSEIWTNQGSQVAIPVFEGEPCTVILDGENTITGYVDESTIHYTASSHTMSVSGRSKTGDLVDCAAVYEVGKGQWLNQGLLQIAQDLCQPFGIAVAAEVDVGKPFEKFRLQDSETAYEALERLARMRHCLLTTDVRGNLLITRAGARRTATILEPGQNVLEASRTGTWRERFKTYLVKAQAGGTDALFGDDAASIKATSVDPGVWRNRTAIIYAEATGTLEQLQERIDWERNVRAGRAKRLRYKLQGWHCAEGLWKPNTIVRVRDDRLRTTADLLVVSVRFVKSLEDGSTTDLELAARRTMTPEPLTPKDDGLSFLEGL